jgi:hypothetical protein
MEGWLTLESYRNRQALSNTHREFISQESD